MSIDTWGDKPKSQVDNSTVDQEIDLKIQAHDDDADAHLDATQSLQSHKASEIIDHLASSIVADKIKDFEVYVEKLTSNKLQFWPSFESFDAWSVYGSGEHMFGLSGFLLTGGPTNGQMQTADCEDSLAGLYVYSKNAIFETLLMLRDHPDQKFEWGAGDVDYSYIGFRYRSSTLYAVITTGFETEVEIELDVPVGFLITDKHTYRFQCFYNDRVDFYIDNVLILSDDTNVPNDIQAYIFFHFKVFTVNISYPEMIVFDCRYIQDL